MGLQCLLFQDSGLALDSLESYMSLQTELQGLGIASQEGWWELVGTQLRLPVHGLMGCLLGRRPAVYETLNFG